jgi:erythromycin esterase
MNHITSLKEDFVFEDDFFLQMLENLLTYIKIERFSIIYNDEEEELVATVNERDHQMARNLIYFKERNHWSCHNF